MSFSHWFFILEIGTYKQQAYIWSGKGKALNFNEYPRARNLWHYQEVVVMNNYEMIVLMISVLGIYTTLIGFVIQLLIELIKKK